MKPLHTLTFALALFSIVLAEDVLEVAVADSGSPEIDRLVARLVSRRPAPIRDGGKIPGGDFAAIRYFNHGRYATAEVERAIKALSDLPPAEFRHLIKHLYDGRYSYSVLADGSPTTSGWTNSSVGDAVYWILSNGLGGGYKWREGSKGKGYSPISFEEYIESQGGYEKWALAVKNRSRADIDLHFLDWCIATEKERGFKDPEQEQWILELYKKQKGQVEQVVEPDAGNAP